MSGKFERGMEKLSIPSEAAGRSRVSLSGRERLRVENHRGILEYGSEVIALRCSGFCLRIMGTELELEYMDSRAVGIRGRISGLELEQ